MSKLQELISKKSNLKKKLDNALLEEKEVDQISDELEKVNRDIRNQKRKDLLEKIKEHQAIIDQRKKNIEKYKADREKFQAELNNFKPKYKEIEAAYLSARAKLNELEEKASRPNMLRKIESAEKTIKQRKEKINELRGEK